MPLLFRIPYTLVPKIKICMKYFSDKNSQNQPLWGRAYGKRVLYLLSYTTTHCLADAYQNNEMFDKILSLLACQMITILMMSEFLSVKE